MTSSSLNWDKFYESGREHYYRSTLGHWKQQFFRNLLARGWEQDSQGNKILITDSFDLFCGLDLFSGLRSENDVFDMDIAPYCSQSIVDRCQAPLTADVAQLPFPSDSFDLIVSPSTLDHFPKRKFLLALEEFERVLQEGGRAIILLHNRHNMFFRFYLLSLLEEIKYYTYTEKEAVQLIDSFDQLKVADSFFVGNLPCPLLLTGLFNRLDTISFELKPVKELVRKFLHKMAQPSRLPYWAELICLVVDKTS